MDCISNAHREGARERRRCSTSTRSCPTGEPRPAHAVAAAAQAHRHHLRARRGRRAALGHQVTGFERHATAGQPRLRAARSTGTSSRDLSRSRAASSCSPADLVLIAIGFTGPEHERRWSSSSALEPRRTAATSRADRPTTTVATASSPAATRASASRWSSPRSPRAASAPGSSTRDLGGSPDGRRPRAARRRPLARTADHSLRAAGMAAGTVRAGEDFFSGPGAED